MSNPLRDILAKAMHKAGKCEGLRFDDHPKDTCYWPHTAHADTILSAFPPDALQAWRDGLALQELRKAAGPGAYWSVRSMGSGVTADVVAGAGDVEVDGHGDTIAEAADEAREALR